MSSRFVLRPAPLAGLKVIERRPLSDERGLLERLFCADDFAAADVGMTVAQVNRTVTVHRGTVRGMHFQVPPHAESKLIYCLSGRVFDVAVDLRRGSPTFLHWHAEELSADNGKGVLIPAGFAHGLQCLEPSSTMLYFHSAAYAAEAERGLQPTDPRLAIRWALPITDMSARDRSHPLLSEQFEGIVA